MVQPKKALLMIQVRTIASAPPEASPLRAAVKREESGLRKKNPEHLRTGRTHGAQHTNFPLSFDDERAQREEHTRDSHDDGDASENGRDCKGLVEDVEDALAQRSVVVEDELTLVSKPIAKCIANRISESAGSRSLSARECTCSSRQYRSKSVRCMRIVPRSRAKSL